MYPELVDTIWIKNIFFKKTFLYFPPQICNEMTLPTMPDLIKKSPFGSPFHSDLKLIDQLFWKMIRMDPIYNSDVAETCVVINSIWRSKSIPFSSPEEEGTISIFIQDLSISWGRTDQDYLPPSKVRVLVIKEAKNLFFCNKSAQFLVEFENVWRFDGLEHKQEIQQIAPIAFKLHALKQSKQALF